MREEVVAQTEPPPAAGMGAHKLALAGVCQHVILEAASGVAGAARQLSSLQVGMKADSAETTLPTH